MESPSTSPMKSLTLSSPIKIENCSLDNGNETSSTPIKIENCSMGNYNETSSSPIRTGNGDSSSSPIKRENESMSSGESGSPKRLRVSEPNLWLEDLFVKKPQSQCTLKACKAVVDDTLDNFYENNVEFVQSMPKEQLIETLEKLSYRKMFQEDHDTELHDTTRFILERIDFVTFINGEVIFLEPYGDYFAAVYVTKNISEVMVSLKEGIFEPENSAVKFFINEIAEQDKSGPLYEIWDELLYTRVFPSENGFFTLPEYNGTNPYLAIERALTGIQNVKPELKFDSIQRAFKLSKKHECLDFESYQNILMYLMNRLLIADLSEASPKTTHGKLLKYSTYYQTLLLKPIYFGETLHFFSDEERIVISNVRDLIEEFKMEIDDIYSSLTADIKWLERDGLYLARSFKILTEKMVLKYMKIFNGLAYGGGWQLIYAERIFTYFLKPMLNSIEDEGIPAIELKNFMALFVSITQFMFEVKQRGISHDRHFSRKELLLTKSEWNGLRKWMENSEENSKLVREVFDKYKSKGPESIRCGFTLVLPLSPAE